MDKDSQQEVKLNALMFGGTGASGKVVLRTLLASDFYKGITVVGRKKLDEWEKLPSEQKDKLKFLS